MTSFVGSRPTRRQPAYPWTNQKLNVHGLYCVLALLLATLARKVAVQTGLDLSLPALLEELADAASDAIREVAVIYPQGTLAHRKDHITLSRMSGVPNAGVPNAHPAKTRRRLGDRPSPQGVIQPPSHKSHIPNSVLAIAKDKP